MKWITSLVAIFLALGLISCSQKEDVPVPETSPAAEPAAQQSPEPVKSSGGGGYEPTADERVPGITMSQEEIDKQTAEALANTPMPDVPGESSSEK
ncbi:MAG TPA: hypothetical protein VNZ84_08970 [Methylophilus sp.]|jgi:hypothetical protein|nr:hypothetical protein [Methylophilus sp.]